jgi:hypothetical protein
MLVFGGIGKTVLKGTYNVRCQEVKFEVGKEKEEKETSKSDKKPKFDYRSSRFFAVLFPAIYATILGIFFLIYDIIPGPEFVILILLIYAAYNHKTWHFVKDWFPFLMVFMSYEAMNGLVGRISHLNLHGGPYMLSCQCLGRSPACLCNNASGCRFWII